MRRVSVPSSRVVIVGAGVSALMFDLLQHGYRSLEAVDVSAAALDELRARLGESAQYVTFTRADVREVRLERPVDVWHDRASFHFLTDPADQVRYVARVEEAVAPGGHLVMATFAPDGPTSCSGLPVARHSADDLARLFGENFELVDSLTREHVTPAGMSQSFLHVLFARRAQRFG